jgi:hypothetical protein
LRLDTGCWKPKYRQILRLDTGSWKPKYRQILWLDTKAKYKQTLRLDIRIQYDDAGYGPMLRMSIQMDVDG